MRHAAKPVGKRASCGLLIGACGLTAIMLVVNRVIVASLYAATVGSSLDVPKIQVLVMFVGIVVLLVPEWWLFDQVMSRTRRFLESLDAARRR